jgi:riboflavin kinase/FMN adenylyltransferase
VEIIKWDDLIQGRKKADPTVSLTIGVFDGIHIGHQKLISTISHEPKGVIPCVITFTVNPATLLKTPSFPGSILTMEQKLTKLKLFGISLVILIDFSYEFSKITGEEFWLSLIHCLHIKKIVVGRNFYFGHKRKSGVSTLKSLSPAVVIEVVEPVRYKGDIVSSTRIRTLIQQGEFNDVASMLGSRYTCDVSNSKADRIEGDLWGIDRSKIDQVLPAKGTYPVLFITDAGDFTCDLMVKDKYILWKKKTDYRELKNIIFI